MSAERTYSAPAPTKARRNRIAQRSCIACRRTAEKTALVRFVRDAQGIVGIDATRRRAGRGAYVCAKGACFEKARKGRMFERALRVAIGTEDYKRLETEFLDFLTLKMPEEQ
ncbi:MAG: YlxR family protein [Coriobacteriales bacterium]|nr:YlxR family protein [Coriobacteriales bacterium]